MVKSYLKYEQSQIFGLVNSSTSNIVWTSARNAPDAASRTTSAGRAYVGADEEVLCWDLKKAELLSRWRDHRCNAEVTSIAQSESDLDIFAVGHSDGSIRVWDSRTASILINFNGHRSAVTCLGFDKTGVRLASGAQDTDIIIWDLVAEVGLFKLRGHKDQITGLQFLPAEPRTYKNVDVDGEAQELADGIGGGQSASFLLSTSKDALLKIWDISSQFCIETHVAQTSGECWSLGISPDGEGCITGGNEGEFKVWSINLEDLQAFAGVANREQEQKFLQDRGVLYRQGKDRTVGINYQPTMPYLAVHGSEKSVEIWRIRSEKEVQRALLRKRKRRREKLAASGEKGAVGDETRIDEVNDISAAELSDIFVPHVIVRTGGKVRSTTFIRDRTGKTVQILTSNTNNQLEVYQMPTKEKSTKSMTDEAVDYTRAYAVELPGHRTDVRSLALSSDDRMLASASNGSLKIWNTKTQACLRTLECGYALCSAFLPGDKIVVLGIKTGELELFDIASSTLIDTVQAHDSAIWTLAITPDGRSLVTGSADKTAKFWTFEIVQEGIPGTKRTTPRLKLKHTRTLKIADDILSLTFSPDSRLLAVATLDNTVKVFFVDSLKLFLNLYGHKLPVLNMSISSDSKLIATCSADKNVRLWGLDFGDCHKAFFAHNDSIMQVSFIPHPISKDDVHNFFSASKDSLVKHWDGQKFEQIQKLEGHHGEIWAMVVSRTGDFVVTASHDKSIRVWSQTDEQIFLEEERERELEEMYESTLATNLDADAAGAEDDENKDEVVAASRQTIATLTAGEKIVEALELGTEDLNLVRMWQAQRDVNPKVAPPARNPIFTAMGSISAERHVLNTLQKIPAAALHDALLVLPFSTLPPLLTFIQIWISRVWNVPLACRVLFFMLRTHHNQIVASREMKTVLEGMKDELRECLRRQKGVVGFNTAALAFLTRRVQEKSVVTVEDEEERIANGAQGGKKRGFVNVA